MRKRAAPEDRDQEPAPERAPEPLDPDVPQHLADMRHVYSRPKREDRTREQKHCRDWLEADPRAFMRAKSQLEGKLLARTANRGRRDDPKRVRPERELCGRCKRLGQGRPLQSCAECKAWFYNELCARCKRLGDGSKPLRGCAECCSWFYEPKVAEPGQSVSGQLPANAPTAAS